MTRQDALIDAAMTVQRWERQFRPWEHYRETRYLGHQIGCYPSWAAIEAEIVRRLLDETARQRLAA